MVVERWLQIKSLFDAAHEKPARERARFLDEVCCADQELRWQVESLLASEDSAAGFLESEETVAAPLPIAAEPVPVGVRIGPYTILELLGAGGMGQVYKAYDNRLDRQVAVKFLVRAVTGDPAAQQRFEREARAASALNHPNICTVHDVGEFQGRAFIVMELLEGQSLKERIAGMPIPLAEFASVSRQVCAALDAAHAKGIVHKDVKPANIFVIQGGQVKILDFGLAKRGAESPGASGAALRPDGSARTLSLTATGAITGTLAYMSPEQALGEDVDARSDIFSLGVVLYEMATGEPPFRGKTAAGILGSILTESPAKPSAENPAVPARLDRVILKALAKDREDRYQSVGRLSADLDEWQPSETAIATRKTRRWMLTAVGALLILAVLAAAGGIVLYLRLGSRPAQIRSVAVLPLENHSGDSGQDYFADGLTEALTGDLAKIRTLRVISRASAMRYRKSAKAAPDIARELKVDALLEGSVIRSGGRARIRLQLIRGATGEHLWSETYEREVKDVPRLQTEVALAVAREIRAKLTTEEQSRLAGRRPVNRDAFDEYLRGRYSWNERTPAAIKTAIGHFRAAIRADPAYAPAFAGLADCYNQLGTLIIGEGPPSEMRPIAAAAAKKALEIDGELAEAHAALAYTDFYDWNWERAEQGFRRAIELSPSNASAHLWDAEFLTARRRFHEALQEVHTARSLDPLSPIFATMVGWMYHFMNRRQEAIAEYRKVLETDSDYMWALWQLGIAYSQESKHDEAVALLERAATLSGRNPAILGTLAWAYGWAGNSAKARELLAELTELARRRYVSPVAFESAYIGLRDLERQFEYLEKEYQERSNALAWFAVMYGREQARADPRGQALLRKLGLAQ